MSLLQPSVQVSERNQSHQTHWRCEYSLEVLFEIYKLYLLKIATKVLVQVPQHKTTHVCNQPSKIEKSVMFIVPEKHVYCERYARKYDIERVIQYKWYMCLLNCRYDQDVQKLILIYYSQKCIILTTLT